MCSAAVGTNVTEQVVMELTGSIRGTDTMQKTIFSRTNSEDVLWV